MRENDVFFEIPEFGTKLNFPETLQMMRHVAVQPISSSVHLDGYAESEEFKFAVNGNGGEYYVYLWKHMFGDVFYVGSGKGDRWTEKNRSSNKEFLKHIDAGDAVVYKILVDVDKNTARKFEQYVSFPLIQLLVRLPIVTIFLKG